MPTFHRIFIADGSSELDLGLIGFGARIASECEARTLVALTPAAGRLLPAFSPIVSRIYECTRAPLPEYRVLPPSDSPVISAEEYRADLILARYSGTDRCSRGAARRLMWEAPCSVWLWPWEQDVTSEPMICQAPEISRVGFALRRDDTERRLLSNCPLLSIRAQPRSTGIRQILRDLFALQEPQFN
jgi:hypothetical protein